MLTCKIWTWFCRDVICNAFLVGECVLGNENTTEYGLDFVFFNIQASTKVNVDSSAVMVSKVAYIESLRRLEKCFRLLTNTGT